MRCAPLLFLAPVQDYFSRVPVGKQFLTQVIQRGALRIVEARRFQCLKALLSIGSNRIELIEILLGMRGIVIKQTVASQNRTQVNVRTDRPQRDSGIHMSVLKGGDPLLGSLCAPPHREGGDADHKQQSRQRSRQEDRPASGMVCPIISIARTKRPGCSVSLSLPYSRAGFAPLRHFRKASGRWAVCPLNI